MGTFIGHFYMCNFLTIVGLYYLIQHIREYFRCILKGKTFHVQLSYSVRESWVKASVFVIKIAGGLVYHFAFDRGARIHQHGSMEFSLLVACLVELAVAYKFTIHKDFQWWAWIQAFLSYFAISYHHSSGNPSLAQFIHTLPLYHSVATVVALLLQLHRPHSLPIALLFPASVLLQGMWFGLISFALYSPVSFIEKWSHPEDPHTIVLIILMFWMIFCIFIIISIIYVTIFRRYNMKDCHHLKTGYYEQLSYTS